MTRNSVAGFGDVDISPFSDDGLQCGQHAYRQFRKILVLSGLLDPDPPLYGAGELLGLSGMAGCHSECSIFEVCCHWWLASSIQTARVY